jgi:hypothetical protein
MAQYAYRHSVSSATVTAEQTYTELERIRAAHDDKLSPRDIVDESRPAKAVLHGFFEWNDKTAGEEYRVQQARRLSRSVYIITPAQGDEPAREGPAYFHIEPNNYQPAEVVIQQADLFEQALQALHRQVASAERAVRELEQAAKLGGNPDRLASIALAVAAFETVKEALAVLK